MCGSKMQVRARREMNIKHNIVSNVKAAVVKAVAQPGLQRYDGRQCHRSCKPYSRHQTKRSNPYVLLPPPPWELTTCYGIQAFKKYNTRNKSDCHGPFWLCQSLDGNRPSCLPWPIVPAMTIWLKPIYTSRKILLFIRPVVNAAYHHSTQPGLFLSVKFSLLHCLISVT